MPVARHSAALFMLFGFQMLQGEIQFKKKKNPDRNLYIFCTNVTKMMIENKKKGLQGTSVVFTEFIYLKVFGFVVFFFFSYFISVIFNCQHCSVHKKFCKEEKKLVVWFLL